MIGIINYGSGNFASVLNAFTSITEDVKTIHNADDFKCCSHIVLPGVGAYKTAMDQIHKLKLVDRLNEEVINLKRPFLGICVGMQLLGKYGFEFEKCEGLGWMNGDVVKFDEEKIGALHLPHMGWNNVIDYSKEPLFRDIRDEDPSFYFVHSFHLIAATQQGVSYTMSDYGYLFPAAVRHGNIFGVQFHPEKSQYNGLQLLKNFISL